MDTTTPAPEWAHHTYRADRVGTVHEAVIGTRVGLQRIDFDEDHGEPGEAAVTLDGHVLDLDEARDLIRDMQAAVAVASA